jgi:hypothetical protein
LTPHQILLGGQIKEDEMRNVCSILIGKPEWKRPPAKPRHRLEFVIKINL